MNNSIDFLREREASSKIQADNAAREHEFYAGKIAAMAQRQAETRATRARKRVIRQFALLLAKGELPREWVFERAATALQTGDLPAVRTTIVIAAVNIKSCQKIARNRELMRLARRGWTNRELAVKYDLSENHVSRILQGELKATRVTRIHNGGTP